MISGQTVSIITPSYNRGDIIDQTAKSIFKQTYSNWEWIIVDDGSTDNSWIILESLAKADKRVKIFQRDREPKGACSCRNIGIVKSTGHYLIFLDTDDLIASFCLEQRVKVMVENPELDLAIFSMLLFKDTPDDLKILWNIDSPTDDVSRIFFQDPVCQGTGSIWNKESFIRIGMWDETLLLWQDIDLHFRTFLRGFRYKKYLDMPPDTFIRVSDISLSRTGYHSLPKFKSRIRVFEKVLKIIKEKNSINSYLAGIRHLFIDLFINGTNHNFASEIEELSLLQSKYKIIENNQFRYFKYYFLFERLKLTRMKLLKNFLISKMKLSDTNVKTTLCSVKYNKKINF